MNHIRKIAATIAGKDRRKVFRQALVYDKLRCMSTVENPPGMKCPQLSIPSGILGQATCHTHPHLISPDHLTCGITQMEYKERRETLVSKLAAEVDNMHKTHIIVIPAANKQYMSENIPYVFRQNSDFFYLTGCLEPSAILVMVKPAQVDNFKSILFVHEKDSHAELWEGPRTGCAAAAHLFCVDEARPVDTFPDYLNKITSTSKPSVLWHSPEAPGSAELRAAVRAARSGAPPADPQRALHFMRVVKSPAEQALMKDVCYAGSQAVNMAMACTKPGVSEHAIAAVLEYSGRLAGAEHSAFPPVVAGGARATHIHYVANNQLLADSELLLVDSGCQRWLYNSDISRTWPVSGRFGRHQRALYELLLHVQRRLLRRLAERPPLDALFDHMCRLLADQLQREGILPKNIDNHELIGRAYRLCPHHVSHYVGLDVHDAPLVRRAAPLRPGMLVTVEPGIYIRPDDTSVPPEFRGIGIRIEDDVLITEGDPVILTESCVKEVQDIEAIVGKHTI